MRIPPLVWLICLLLVLVLIFSKCSRDQQKQRIVGVSQAQVTTKMDLTNKLDPAILPDLLKEILREMAPNQKPKSDEFQKQVVQKLSQRIMEDPEVNYRVDLNSDGNLDPVLVVPESIENEAGVYSVRVPDPDKYSKDPTSNSDWNKIAEDGIELCALSMTFNESTKTMVVDAAPNEHLYQDSQRHYRSEYPARQHSWMETYFTYMIFRDILFRPYGWYGPGWYGGWYGGYYGGWHAPVYTRPVTTTRSRYRSSPSTTSTMRTSSGSSVRSSRSATRTRPPSFVSRGQSRSTSASSTTRSSTTRSSTRSTRSSTRSVRGGSRGTGK